MSGLEIVGATTMVLLGAAATWILYQLAKDALYCGIFTWRVARIATRSRGRLHFLSECFMFWLKTWLGINSRPDRMQNTATGKIAYWPGQKKKKEVYEG